MSQDQPPGIDPDDPGALPDSTSAAARVGDFLEEYGYGVVVPATVDEFPPLYARDLAALVDVHNQGLVLTAHIGWELAEVTSQRDQARGIAAHLEGELAQIPVNFAHVLADAQYEIRELKSRLAGVTTYTRDPADEKSEGGSVSQDSTPTPDLKAAADSLLEQCLKVKATLGPLCGVPSTRSVPVGQIAEMAAARIRELETASVRVNGAARELADARDELATARAGWLEARELVGTIDTDRTILDVKLEDAIALIGRMSQHLPQDVALELGVETQLAALKDDEEGAR